MNIESCRAPQEPLVAGPLRILLVEDSPFDAQLLLEELKANGVACQHQRVETRQDMLDALRASEWDVIISDYHLPTFSGMEALLLVLEEGYDLPFLIVSGMIGESTAVEAMKAGAQDYLMKGNLSRLVPAIRNAIRANELKRMHARAEEEVKSSREQLRRLTGHLEQVREQERLRIARDLHDAVGANLTAMKMDVCNLCKVHSQDGDELKQRLHVMAGLIDDSIGEIRRMISELRPSILDDLGLLAAIDWQLGEFASRHAIGYELVIDPALENRPIASDISIAAFRIVQEALNNVGRHAAASRVEVTMEMEDDALAISIQDNGEGFAPGGVDGREHFGLIGMRERARNLHGRVDICSTPGQGCAVTVLLPLAADR